MTFSFKTLMAVSLVTLALNGCQPVAMPATTGAATAPSAITEVMIKTHDFSYDAPQQLEAGWVAITMENMGVEPHHTQVARLHDGVTSAQFLAALKQGEGPALALISFKGGPGVVDAKGQQQVTIELEPGDYFLLCFVPSQDGVPHLAKGMVMPFKVVAGKTQAAPPKFTVAGVVKLLDFAFVLPTEIKAGKQVWEVKNEGTEPHELALIKLAAGKTMDDVMHFMMQPAGVPPFTNAGGFQAIDPNKIGYLQMDLTSGNYVALCHVPSQAHQGKRHEELGMVMPFSVQ